MADRTDVAALYEGLRAGHRPSIARALTLVESTHPDHEAAAAALIERCIPHLAGAPRIGITGVPGAGKSTFIDALGMQRIAGGQRVGVCAIDPSSTHTRGSILGDKTRMTRLAAAEQAFVRPTPNAGAYGGVASRTREALVILEAAGFEVLFVETVGVGQSETRVADLVDVVVVLTLTGAGDALQGMKRGILEIADLLVVHKADGDNRPAALRLRAELKQTLHLFQPVRPGWEPRVAVASSIDGSGLGDVWEGIEDFLRTQKEAGAFHENREQQATRWLHDRIAEGLHRRALGRDDVQALIHRLEEAVRTGDVLPPAAAQDVLNVV